MSEERRAAHPENGERERLSPRQRRRCKQRLLTQGTPALVPSITGAVVVKDEDLFFLSGRDGQVSLEGKHGYGLYYHDCRFLKGYELRLNGRPPTVLAATAKRGFMATLELTNADIRTVDRH